MARFVYRTDPATGQVRAYELGVEILPEELADDGHRMPVFTDRYMEGLRTDDGVDIGSRSKRREYMHVNGVADVSDYRETWAKAEKQRAAFFQGKPHDTEARRQDIARALETVKQRGKR